MNTKKFPPQSVTVLELTATGTIKVTMYYVTERLSMKTSALLPTLYEWYVDRSIQNFCTDLASELSMQIGDRNVTNCSGLKAN